MTAKEYLIALILKREKYRKISKIKRLLKSPFRTFPYYILAYMSHIKPFILTFKTLWGDKITADLPNGNTFLYYGYPEANLTNFFIKNIKEDEIFIDGGANIGFYSLLINHLAPKGHIHSFEPTPSTFSLLIKNTRDKKNIFTNRKALFDKKDTIEFIDYGIGYNAFNSIHASSEKLDVLIGRGKKIKVDTIKLDDYCIENNVKPTFIKLDLEGSELYALEGCKNILMECKPALSIEVAGGDTWSEFTYKTDLFLKDLSYLPFSIEDNGLLKEHKTVTYYQYENLIYIHKDKVKLYIS
ncbi:MAG: FkbM Family Methyltransferase [Bacteroidota bacterium]|jgi:FkbM family methyltransferase